MGIDVFIDGEAGTTGLQIAERLSQHSEVTLLSIDEDKRKDAGARAGLLNSAHAVILCLPDDAAREAVSLITNDTTRVIDASTAHRVAGGWAFGFPEMTQGQREAIQAAKRVSNPGCYSTGAIALIRPLVDAGILSADANVSIAAQSGYSGGGKNMIARYEDKAADNYDPRPFRLYGLDLAHKHTEEMRVHCGLKQKPVFIPRVVPIKQGMIVEVPLFLNDCAKQTTDHVIRNCLEEHYKDERFVSVASIAEMKQTPDLYIDEFNGTNAMKLRVFADEAGERVLLTATLDNLGKGASGAAVQNLNVMFGFDEALGLNEPHAI